MAQAYESISAHGAASRGGGNINGMTRHQRKQTAA